MPGYLCNYNCSHCANSSGPNRKEKISFSQSSQIIDDLNNLNPKVVLFTGGEPTLHIDIINQILNGYKNLDKSIVTITTNGWFALSKEKTEDVLNRVVKIDNLQLSFDLFHMNESNFQTIIFLKDYCFQSQIDFNISICISNPEQVLVANDIVDKTGVDVIYQKVEASGRATFYGNAFKYLAFDNNVWDKECPSKGSLHFGSDFGYTTCCSNLIFNNKSVHGLVSKHKLDEYRKSKFFDLIENKTFREISNYFGNSLSDDRNPKYSSPCTLCEKIFLDNKDKL